MICQTCSSLAFTYTNRKCLRCAGFTNINLSVLCDTCSNKDKICSVCLRKIDSNTNKNIKGGCRCGNK